MSRRGIHGILRLGIPNPVFGQIRGGFHVGTPGGEIRNVQDLQPECNDNSSHAEIAVNWMTGKAFPY